MTSVQFHPEIVRASPDREDRTYAYLERGRMNVEVKNTLSTDILLDQLTCIFEEGNNQYLNLSNIHIPDLEPGELQEVLPSAGFPANPGIRIGIGETSPPIQVAFDVRASFKLHSNRCKIGMRYRTIASGRVSDPLELQPAMGFETYVVIRNISRRELTIFLSHKIPQNTIIALRFREILERLGFDGYLAEEGVRTGVENLWSGELYPEIDRSRAVVVFWTLQVQQGSEGIESEIQHAKDIEKKVYPVLIKGCKSKRFYELFPKRTYQHISLDAEFPLKGMIQLAFEIQQDVQEGNL